MKAPFIDFWHAYAPLKQFSNRYLACQRLWDEKDDDACALILSELEQKRIRDPTQSNEKNPYFYLLDWQPPQPQWLSPRETGYLLAQGVPLAVCRNPLTQCFGTVTRAEADTFALEVHHYM